MYISLAAGFVPFAAGDVVARRGRKMDTHSLLDAPARLVPTRWVANFVARGTVAGLPRNGVTYRITVDNDVPKTRRER